MLSIADTSTSAQPSKPVKAPSSAQDKPSGGAGFSSHLDDKALDTRDEQSTNDLGLSDSSSLKQTRSDDAQLSIPSYIDDRPDGQRIVSTDTAAADAPETTDINIKQTVEAGTLPIATTESGETSDKLAAQQEKHPPAVEAATRQPHTTDATPPADAETAARTQEQMAPALQKADRTSESKTKPSTSSETPTIVSQSDKTLPQTTSAQVAENAATARNSSESTPPKADLPDAAPQASDVNVKSGEPTPTLSATLDAKSLTAQTVETPSFQLASSDLASSPVTQTVSVSPNNTVTMTRAVPLSTPAMIAPTDIPNVLTQTLSSPDKQAERVVVQLDPPELGRISIDFKFDAGTLQAVTITGETPEALRQLRLMHFELINSLEQQGLSGSDLTFTHQQFSDQSPQSDPFSTFGEPDGDYADISLATLEPSRRQASNTNGLDIKL